MSQITNIKKNSFAERVREVVRRIPKGETRTYGEVAAAAGSAGAARAVGLIMKNNYDPTVPCHRVIRSDGKMGGYNRGGSEVKEKMLRNEAKATEKSTTVPFAAAQKPYKVKPCTA